MPERSDLLAEAYKRNILPPDMRSAYEEAQKRGMVGTESAADSPVKSSTPEEKSDTSKLSQDGGSFLPDPIRMAKNVPGSAARLAGGIASTVMHPIETARGLGRVAGGGIEKLRQAFGAEESGAHVKYFDAAIEGLKERYGGWDAIKKTIETDPVGFLADASTILGGGETVLTRIPGLAKAGEVSGAIGKAVNPVNLGAKGIEKVIEHGAPLGAGLMTGKGVSPFKTAIEAGRDPSKSSVFTKEMRDPDGEALVKRLNDAVDKLHFDESTRYQRDMKRLGQNPKVLDFNLIKNDFRRAITDFSYGSQEVMDPSIAKTAATIEAYLKKWESLPPGEYRTAAGLDALKKLIGNVRNPNDPAGYKFATKVYDSIEGTITREDPRYAQTMENYHKFKKLLTEAQKTLGAGKKTTEDTALRKILSSSRSNVNTNFGAREKLIEKLGKYDPNLKTAIAGHVLNPMLPGGLAQVPAIGEALGALTVNPKFAAGLVGSSPRAMGEASHGFGRLQRFMRENPALARRLLKAALLARATGQPSR